MNKRTKKAKQDSGSSQSGGQKQQSNAGDKDVVVLDQTNFDAIIFGSKDIWMVEFYAPWCGHCKALEPEWNAAATKMKGQVKFAKVDATENQALAQRFGVRGYPTIKYFDYGPGKTDASAQDYNGGREERALSDFANMLLDKADIEPEVYELIK